MLNRFLDAVADRLAKEWLVIGAQSLVFWAGGFAAVAWGTGRSPVDRLHALAPGAQALFASAALLAFVLSGAAVRRLTPVVLTFLEGYGWPGRLRRYGTARQEARRHRLRERWERLHAALGGAAQPVAPDTYDAFVRTDAALRRIPGAPERQLPTWVGNTLRAAELRPYQKYGLDAVKCWPHLWLVLPAEARDQIARARAALDSAVSALIWSAGFVVWTPWAGWAAPVAAVAATAVYHGALRRPCAVLADLLEASYDLHRTALYTALRWPLPTDPAHERESGRLLTAYLWRGSDAPVPVFTSSPDAPEPH
ncbi:hypothetical protein Q3V23_01985 [Streptomyces sp. VNUA116]|uniref:hypothetical protein n=1 Tax=Streptomyces sp. VNUA116 TaxID=3062449 RepID=UPI002677657D|nr:hypothetical protein [Streptomyces sp. VNUA116]WKU42935.1 hypothetical protein Q3V23_01985 [Streptomyces sp. VNUA116]